MPRHVLDNHDYTKGRAEAKWKGRSVWGVKTLETECRITIVKHTTQNSGAMAVYVRWRPLC